MPTIELVILNYNGKHHLEHLLPTAIAESRRYSDESSVVVIDNQSTADDVKWIKNNFNSVRVWNALKNDFLYSYNDYAAVSSADVLLILNNDLKLKPGFVEPLIKHFKSPDVFAVSAISRDWDDTSNTFGANQFHCHHGHYSWAPNLTTTRASHTLFASGGFMAVDRRKFIELGGFDRLFYPAYCEDLDLCFRAWRHGWRCIIEPESVALHRDHGSWGKEAGSQAERMMLQNNLLFAWLFLPANCGLLERASFEALEFARATVRGKTWILTSKLYAWRRWRDAKKVRSRKRVTNEELVAIQAAITKIISSEL